MNLNEFERKSSGLESAEFQQDIELKAQMMSKINELFQILLKDNQYFSDEDINQFRKLVKEYNTRYKRLLYSEFSSKFFDCSEEEEGRALTNLEEISDLSFANIDKGKADKIDLMIIKIYDHLNLANQQLYYLKNTDEVIKDKVESFLEEQLQGLKDGMEENNRNVTTNLISLVGIFTALSFVVFGGITSFQSIFSNIRGIPLTKVMILGCIWAIAIVNIVFFLIYFMAKLTGRDIKTNPYSSSILKRYPLITIINMIIVTIFILSLWLRFVEISSGNEWMIGLTKNNKDLLSFGSIAVLVIIGAIWSYIYVRINRPYD
ncbi:hypothetical protein MKD03_17900 [[Clostridium] innocuum]|nr:hypothetical protein [[Clostridium] innocuum]